MFQSLCTALLVTAVVHHRSFFPTRAASKHPTAATVTANRTMNFLCKNLTAWISRREVQKEPNFQHTWLEKKWLLEADVRCIQFT